MPQTILHLAVKNNAKIDAIIQALAAPGVGINEQDDNGDTALHIAVKINNSAIVSLLMKNGANYKIRNNQRKTPKGVAKDLGNWDIVATMELESELLENRVRENMDVLQQQNQQLNTEITRLTELIQRLDINQQQQQRREQPRFLRFLSWQTMELLALGTTVVGAATVIQHQGKRINSQKETITNLNNTLKQEQQMYKEAISFLYDKMQDAHKVAFKTGQFPVIGGSLCNSHGELMAIPEGFEEKDCSFFSAGGSSFNGDVQHHISYFTAGNTMQLPYEKGGGRCYGAYSVSATKPVMSKEEIARKKTKYRLI